MLLLARGFDGTREEDTWHVMEVALHHGGELVPALGGYGLTLLDWSPCAVDLRWPTGFHCGCSRRSLPGRAPTIA